MFVRAKYHWWANGRNGEVGLILFSIFGGGFFSEDFGSAVRYGSRAFLRLLACARISMLSSIDIARRHPLDKSRRAANEVIKKCFKVGL
jgi:hypothetical protein